MTRPGTDVVVLAALDLEYAAVRVHLTDLRTHVDANGTRYETGRSRGGRCRVALALTGQGNLAAAVVATRAVTWLRPKALVLIGVAGGIARDVELGDVVVATRVHAYHSGRAGSGGFRPRPRSWPLAHRIDQDAREVARSGAWTRLLPGEAAPPVVHFKPLVSGEVVLDARAGPIAQLIEEHYNDAVAIDMESAGVAEAAHHNDFHQTVTVRAISDLADGSKRDTDATGWQPRAATHAAAFAIALAERIASGPGGTGLLTSYREQVESIAPERLLDREEELAELARFAAGDVPYAWWQAGPWAGKSALMSWFVLHPPEGVDVVSFFVTSRLAAQQDSDAFTRELTHQLAALTGEPPHDRQNQLWCLLDEAGGRSRCLLVVIDGLDEDAGPAHGKPSIASLLPQRPPPNVRILIASRPDPRVPDDVLDEDHPLLTCPRRELTASPHARSIGRRAVHELNEHLRGDELGRDVLGLITASGGGITRGDLEELTGRPPYEIDRLLAGPLGRTIGSRPAPLRPDENEPVHLFAHETLAQTAQDKFGASVRSYQARLHMWAEGYRAKGWPRDTPQYLLVGYPYLLVDEGDHDRLVAVATDRARHDRMLRRSGGDALAVNEVRLAQDVLCRQQTPNLSALLLLAAHRDGLVNRNSAIPVRLPLVWTMLGDTARADALARGITDLRSQARSLIVLAGLAAGTGERFHALVTEVRTLVRDIPHAFDRDEVISELARTVAAAGEPVLAVLIAQDTADAYARERLLADLTGTDGDDERILPPPDETDAVIQARSVTTAWTAGDHDLAAALFEAALTRARRIEDDPLALARAAIAVVETAGTGGAVPPPAVLDEVEDIVRALSGKDLLESMAWLAKAAASVGDQDRAHALLVDSGRLVDQLPDPQTRDWAVRRWLLPGALAAREYNWVFARVRGFADSHQQAGAAAELVESAAGSADRDRALSLITDAVAFVQSLHGSEGFGFAFGRMAVAAAGSGEHERAAAVMNHVAAGPHRDLVLADLAEAAMGDGDLERATSLVWQIADESDKERALARLVERAAKAGQYERARGLASSITDHSRRTDAQSKLVSTATAGGAWDQAAAVVDDMADGSRRTDALAELVVAIAAAGDPDRGRNVAVEVSGPRDLPELLTRLAAAAAGDRSRVLALLTEAATVAEARLGPDARSYVLDRAVEVAVAAGLRDQALALTRDIVNPYSQVNAFTRLAEATAAAGDHDTARELAVKVEAIARDELNTTGSAEFTGLAVASVLIGDRDRARRLTLSISDVDWRVWALEQLARADPESTRALLAETIAGAGAIPHGAERAGALIRLVPIAGMVCEPDLLRSLITKTEVSIAAAAKVEARANLLALLAQAVAVAGVPDAARQLLARAESLAGAMPDPGGKVYPRYEIATTLEFELDRTVQYELATAAIAIGDFQRARTLAGGLTAPDERHTVLTELALAASKAGDHELTVAVVRGIGSSLLRHQALEKLTKQATAAGDHDLARSLALETTSGFNQTDMLTWLARFATATGDYARAESLVRAIPGTSGRAEGLLWLVRAAVAAGDHERARTLAGELSGSDRKHAERYLSGETPAVPGLYPDTERTEAIVDILIAAGDGAAASTVARDRAYGSHPIASVSLAPALAKLVDAELAAGDHERALAVAREITDPQALVDPLSRVVAAAAAAGDTARVRSLLAEVLVLGRWYESVMLAARVAPDALTPVLDELEARRTGRYPEAH